MNNPLLNVRPDIIEATESVEGKSMGSELNETSLKQLFFNENLSDVQDQKLM